VSRVSFDPRKWVQVADSLRAQIDAGELKPGDRVSIRNESRKRAVNKQTVTKAARELAAEGRLLLFPGHGYIVANPDK
jgi:GntR family transcriptional regulator